METRIAGQLLPHRLEPTGFSHEARARLGARRGGKNHDKVRLIGCEPPDDVAALRTAGRHLWDLVRINRPTTLEAAPFHQPGTQVVPCAEKDGGSDLCRFVSDGIQYLGGRGVDGVLAMASEQVVGTSRILQASSLTPRTGRC